MAELRFPWIPRIILTGRVFRLPVQADDLSIALQAEGFRELGRRWCERDSALYFYLQAPSQSGDYALVARHRDSLARTQVQVRTLDELRQSFAFNGAIWPRRWPLGQAWESTKTRQTLQDLPLGVVDLKTVQWWLAQDDATLWQQFPPAELPRAHFVNVHQGCPQCGTAIFFHSGFYPWKRNHLPCDFRSTCPSCGAVFPSNDLAAGDFTSGDRIDDGYGYFDAEGHLFLFAATYCRDQIRACWSAVDLLTRHLRTRGFDPEIARKLGLLLLRHAVEEIYLAAVPQFRYGPSLGVEEPWNWGQPDWGADPEPVAALYRKGTVHYCIDVPYVSESLALAYDTIWPFLKEDQELVERAQALGVKVCRPSEVIQLVEEMLASLVQCGLDQAAASNLPRVSQGLLVLLRGLDRPDAQEVLSWLYDRGPDRLRVFGTNDFFPDGTPPEATGGYNSIHTDGLFALEYHLRHLRHLHPKAYPEAVFPSLVADPRAPRVARAPHEIAVIGRTWFQFGDGGSGIQPGRLEQECFHAPMSPTTLKWAAEFTGDPGVKEILEAVEQKRHRRLGTTVHDGVGIAILRTDEVPERAAAGIVYGDATHHRHMDLLDVQLFAFDHLFLSDLGYPQSWASIDHWEGHWATHNSVWGVVPGTYGDRLAGRGRLVRHLEIEGVRLVEVVADRWAWDEARQRWFRPGVRFRRLLALVDPDGQGVALIDLAQIQGGIEHWRICRGLEGEFHTEVQKEHRPGTMAGPEIERGQVERIAQPDRAALAYMDEVAVLAPPPTWKGYWQFRREPGVYLDLHQLRVTPGTQVFAARATAIMGKPEESTYCYRTVLWQRQPSDSQESTCVDLVFEPRVGPATLSQARAIAASTPKASGVELVSVAGRRLRLYWAPEAGPGESTAFADGTELQGNLALVVDGRLAAQGTSWLKVDGRAWLFSQAVQRGRIVALNRRACTVEVEGLEGIAVGDRIRVNPVGRGHTYRVERVEGARPGRCTLQLDVTSLLGRGQVRQVEGRRVELGYPILARTGNLEQTRLEREGSGEWEEIAAAFNPDAGSTVIELKASLPLRPGEWVEVVDYEVGDEVLFEPVHSLAL